jgi:hypothetical protein
MKRQVPAIGDGNDRFTPGNEHFSSLTPAEEPPAVGDNKIPQQAPLPDCETCPRPHPGCG